MIKRFAILAGVLVLALAFELVLPAFVVGYVALETVDAMVPDDVDAYYAEGLARIQAEYDARVAACPDAKCRQRAIARAAREFSRLVKGSGRGLDVTFPDCGQVVADCIDL